MKDVLMQIFHKYNKAFASDLRLIYLLYFALVYYTNLN